MKRFALSLLAAVLAACGADEPGEAANVDTYDIVIAGGRVIDPESGFDGVRNLGLRGGIIADISAHSNSRQAPIRSQSSAPTTL